MQVCSYESGFVLLCLHATLPPCNTDLQHSEQIICFFSTLSAQSSACNELQSSAGTQGRQRGQCSLVQQRGGQRSVIVQFFENWRMCCAAQFTASYFIIKVHIEMHNSL